MKLSDIPPIVFGLIVPFLGISDFVSLYLTGTRRLIYSLSDFKGTKEIAFYLEEDPGVTKMPNFSRLLPSLKRLTILNVPHGSVISVAQTPLNYLPSSLEHLELHFYSARDWFFHLPQNPGHEHLFSPTLAATKGFRPPIDNSPWRTNLFPNLKTLKLSGGSTCGCWSDVAFAPNLESLYLENTNGFNEDHLPSLPTSLTELRIPFNTSLVPSRFGLLPRTLQTLELSPFAYDTTFGRNFEEAQRCLELLPQLTWLNFTYHNWMDPKLLAALPSSLLKLRIDGRYVTNRNMILNLPRNLIYLDAALALSPAWVPDLPLFLEELCGVSMDPTCFVPTFDEDLAILSTPLALPVPFRNMKAITLISTKRDHALRTLRIMTCFSFSSALEELIIDSPLYGDVIPFISSLPSSLKTLSLVLDSAALQDEFDALAELEALEFPESLTSLSLRFACAQFRVQKARRNTFDKFEAFIDDGKIADLPYSLKRFAIGGDVALYGALIRLLPHSLHSLTAESPKSKDDISWFNDLPQRLRFFSFSHFKGPIDAEYLKGLPHSLRDLHLRGVSGIASKDVQFLPPELTSLVMPDVVIDVEDMHLLPKTLNQFQPHYGLSQVWLRARDDRIEKRR